MESITPTLAAKLSPKTPFSLPEIFIAETSKVLCIGMGGGCDVITAYVVAQHLPGLRKGNVAWGNTKRVTTGLEPVTEDKHVWRVPEFQSIKKGQNYYGTCGIDAAVPQGPHQSPLVVKLPRVPKLDGPSANPPKVSEDELKAIGASVASLGFDAIIGVDAGGDSITGGIDHNGDPSQGVDQMMLRVLKYSGLPFLQIVCGMGCDGESPIGLIAASLQEEEEDILGTVEMTSHDWGKSFTELAGELEPYRTPNLMAEASRRFFDEKQPGSSTMVIERGIKPEIPIDMLSHAYIFVRN